MFKVYKKEIEVAGKKISLETGKVARQADGAIIASCGETVILATVVGAKKVNPDMDYFPLSVNYQEKYYAGGKIPGGYFKREARPTESEQLISRLIDRPIRPLFPSEFKNEVQLLPTVISYDKDNQPDILAIFTPQAPVEQAVTPQRHDVREDDGFQRIMEDANHRVAPAKENNKPEADRQNHSPSQKPSDKKQIEKSKSKEGQQIDQTESKKVDQNIKEEPLSETESTSKESENIAPQELASVDNFEEAMGHIKELGFDVQAMETLLEILNNDSGLDIGALLQSLTAQNSKLKDFSFQDFISTNNLNENSFSQLENRKGLINDLLKQAGFTDKEAKNFIQKFESQQNKTSNLNGELAKQDFSTVDKTIKPEVASQASKDLVNIETGGKKKEETTVKKIGN